MMKGLTSMGVFLLIFLMSTGLVASSSSVYVVEGWPVGGIYEERSDPRLHYKRSGLPTFLYREPAGWGLGGGETWEKYVGRQDRGLLALTRRKQRMKEEQRGASRVKVTRHWTLCPVQPDVNLSLQTANIKHLTITTLSFSLGPPQYQYQLTDK